MRYRLLGSPILLAALTSCSSSPSATVPAANAPTNAAAPAPAAPAPAASTILPPPDTARAAAAGPQADTLASARQAHVFSQAGAPDVFRLVLRGDSVLKGPATFTITDAGGQVIFREVLSAAELEAPMVYEMKTATTTPAAREAFVRRRVREFFRPAQFARPAVAAAAPHPAGPDAADRATWDDLRRRPQSVRFTYLVGKEDRRVIAWSPLKKQVVRVGP